MGAAVCIESARLEEYVGEVARARAALSSAQVCDAADWKVFLEQICMAVRQGQLDEAREVANAALEMHPATGRLWAALISLEHNAGSVSAAATAFRRAVREVPKSGEVWCEGARIYLNPLGSCFSLSRARRCLAFAAHLTPQYGDSFLELLRLRMLVEIAARTNAEPLAQGLMAASGEGTTGAASDAIHARRSAIAACIAERVCSSVAEDVRAGRFAFEGSNAAAARNAMNDRSAADLDASGDASELDVDDNLAQVELSCAYAEPNYGCLWFWCRPNVFSTPKEVLLQMRTVLVDDILRDDLLSVYTQAVAYDALDLQLTPNGGNTAGMEGSAKGNTKLVPTDFALGSVLLARCFAHGMSSLDEVRRQRLVFGSDIVCV